MSIFIVFWETFICDNLQVDWDVSTVQ